jgi:hypothetical protein
VSPAVVPRCPQQYDRSGASIPVARKPNYDFEKRRKELDRQAKKEAKREDRLRRKREGATESGEPSAPPEAEGPPGLPTE